MLDSALACEQKSMVFKKEKTQGVQFASMKNQQVNINDLMDVMAPDLDSGTDKIELSSESKLSVKLEEKELWGKFKEYTNEMIVTKNGRYIRYLHIFGPTCLCEQCRPRSDAALRGV